MSNSSRMPVPIAVMSACTSRLASTLSMRFFSTLMILPRSGRIACVLRARPCFAEPPARAAPARPPGAPSRVALDHEELGERGIAHRAVGQLARQRRVLERRLAAREVAGLARGLAGARGLHRLADDAVGLARVLLEELGQPAVDGRLDEALDRRVAELRLGLALELRLLDLHGDDRREPLAHVLTLEVGVLLLELALLARVRVDRARERRAEA